MPRSRSPKKKIPASRCRGYSKSDCLEMKVNCVYNRKIGCVKRANVMRLDLPPYVDFEPSVPTRESVQVNSSEPKNKYDELKQQFDNTSNELNRVKSELDKINQLYDYLKQKCKDSSKYESLLSKYNSLLSDIIMQRNLIQVYTESFKTRIKDCEGKNSVLDKDLKVLNLKYENEVENAKITISKLQETEKSLNDATSMNILLETKLRELTSEYKDVSNKLLTIVEEKKELESKLLAFLSQKDKSVNDRTLIQKNNNITENLNESLKLNELYKTELEQQIKKLSLENDKLTLENTNLKGRIDPKTFDEIFQACKIAEKSLQQLINEKNELAAKFKEHLTKSAFEHDKLIDKNQRMDKQLQQLKTKNTDLESKVRQIKKLENNLSDCERLRRNLEEDIKIKESKLVRDSDEVQKRDKIIMKLTQERDKLKINKKQCEEKLTYLEYKVEDDAMQLGKIVKQHRNEIQLLESKLIQSDNLISRLQSQVKNCKTFEVMNKLKEQQIYESQSQLKTLNQKLKNAEETESNLRKELRDLKKEKANVFVKQLITSAKTTPTQTPTQTPVKQPQQLQTPPSTGIPSSKRSLF